MTTKPTFVLFPGAFHPASCLEPLTKLLSSGGYPNSAHTLLSVGDASKGVSDDAEYFLSILKPKIAAGEEIVLVVHSYAGFPGTASIKGLDKGTRAAQGDAGGILGIIYLTAFVPLDGESLFNIVQNKWPWWQTEKEDEGLVYTHSQQECFYHDVNPDEAGELTALLKGQSTKSFKEVPAEIGWRDSGYNGRRAYIICDQDKAIPVEVQHLFVDRSGVEWIVKNLDASHSPFLSMPETLFKTLVEITEKFQAA